MSRIRELRRRANAIDAALAGTLAVRLRKLTDDQRRVYDGWRSQCERWRRADPDLSAYERLLDGDAPPALRSDVYAALFGTPPAIPANATQPEAAEIYRRCAEGM